MVESGRLNAAMRFHIDTRSAANQDAGSRFDLQNRVDVAGQYGAGPLDRLAGAGQVDRIRVNTLNPDAEEAAARTAREARLTAARASESQRVAAALPAPAQSPQTIAIRPPSFSRR